MPRKQRTVATRKVLHGKRYELWLFVKNIYSLTVLKFVVVCGTRGRMCCRMWCEERATCDSARTE